MSGVSLVEEGDGIPVVLQIQDGNATQFVKGIIYDDAGDELTTLDLVNKGDGLYRTVWSMTDDPFVTVVYIVYETLVPLTESTTYGRDVDTFMLIIPGEYKATGFATPGEYDTEMARLDVNVSSRNDVTPAVPNEYDVRMAAIQADLDTPDQYKADVTNLDVAVSTRSPSGEYDTEMARLDVVVSTRADQNPPSQILNDYKANVAGLAPSNEYDVELAAIQADLDNPDQYKATGFNTVVPDPAGTVPTNPVLVTDARLDNLDVAVSTRADENPPSQILGDYKADVTNLDAAISTRASGAELAIAQSDITFLKNVEGGRWKIDNYVMTFYEADNTTPIMSFNLLDASGQPTETNVLERVRNP